VLIFPGYRGVQKGFLLSDDDVCDIAPDGEGEGNISSLSCRERELGLGTLEALCGCGDLYSPGLRLVKR
jgi:hypothetical protein